MRYLLKKDIVDKLINDFGYPRYGANLVASKLLHLQKVIKPMFIDWWFSEKKPDVNIEGYTFDRLTKSHKMNPFAAFLTLDWLLREPERAKESLKRGYDLVNINS